MRICEMVEAGLVGKPRRFFFTDAHGWHRGSWLQELWGSQPRRWTSISCAIPHRVMPRPGCEDGMVDTVEKYIAVYHKEDTLITVEDALQEVGASTEFPRPPNFLLIPNLED
jgi:hypothetical protein